MRLVFFEQWMHPVAEQVLSGTADLELVRLRYDASDSDNWGELRAAHGYHVSSRGDIREPWLVGSELLEKCPSLLAISSTGAGYDVINVEACTAAGVIVCNQTGANVEAVAEHTLGMMLALSKKITVTDKALRRGTRVDRYAHSGNDIFGKTLGMIGIGNIGTRVSRLSGTLFNMTVLACDPYLSAEQIAARGATKVGLDELLPRADFVTVHCPRSNETFGMIGREQFASMKPTAYFINTARGGIHKEDDLVAALNDKILAGAGVDVFLHEPPPATHPLLAFDNVIATPHNAGVTAEAMYNLACAAAEQWTGIFKGFVPPRLVNQAAWPKYAKRFERVTGFRPAALP